MIQRNRSTLKGLNEDAEAAPLTAGGNDPATTSSADKSSKIANNLALFENAAPSFGRAPLQMKGYSWRFPRIFNQYQHPSGTGNDVGMGGLEDGSQENWRQWASNGIKRRSCKIITILLLVGAVCILTLVLSFSAFYGWIYSRDPCVVSVDTSHKLKAFPRKSHLVPDFKPVLPKIIHQQWKNTTIPEGVYSKWNAKFKELFPEPEFKHMLWTDDNARELIKNDFPHFLEAYNGYKFGIQRADAARYFVLYKYGGLYADLDYEPLVDFWEHLPKDRVALVESPYLYNEKSQNSLMSSPVADPFWNETFTLLMERKDKPVLQATGPMFLDALMKKATETYTLLPCENFQRLPLHLSAEEEVSPFMSQLHRELLGRLAPMKYCGDYHKPECQYGKHHNTASYLPDTGVLALLWT